MFYTLFDMYDQIQHSTTTSTAWGVAFLQDQTLKRALQNQIRPTLTSLSNQEELFAVLRDVRLLGDSSVSVYANAMFRLTKCPIGTLSPLACYALESQLAQHKKLFWFLQQFGQNLFDLNGVLGYRHADKNHRLIPPIIETYEEPKTGKKVSAIIDGLHRILAARQLGFSEIWAVEITGVPRLLPPIALPVAWDEVVVGKTVPPATAKRRYRFAAAANYPDLSSITSQKITAQNYQYFLYRDFSTLGSDGIRTSTA